MNIAVNCTAGSGALDAVGAAAAGLEGKVRDELVEVAPGAHLGKMLWHHGEDTYSLAAYFALRT